MLNQKRRALKVGVMVAALSGVILVACSKSGDDTPPPTRSTVYKIFGDPKSADAAKQVGVVTIKENTNKTFDLTMTLDKTLKDIKHRLYIISGDTTAPLVDTIYNKEIAGTGSNIVFEIAKNENRFSYDSALNRKAFVKILKAQGSDSIISRGNIFKSVKP